MSSKASSRGRITVAPHAIEKRSVAEFVIDRNGSATTSVAESSVSSSPVGEHPIGPLDVAPGFAE